MNSKRLSRASFAIMQRLKEKEPLVVAYCRCPHDNLTAEQLAGER